MINIQNLEKIYVLYCVNRTGHMITENHLHNIAVVVKIGTQHYDKFALSNAVAAIHSIQKYDAEEVMMVRHRILKCKIMSKKKDLQGLGRPTSIIVSIRAMLIIKGKVSTYLHELKHSKLVSMER